MRSTLDHFEGDKLLVTKEGEKKRLTFFSTFFLRYFRQEDLLQVPAQPYGREVAPAKLSHNVISIVEEVANFHGMVST